MSVLSAAVEADAVEAAKAALEAAAGFQFRKDVQILQGLPSGPRTIPGGSDEALFAGVVGAGVLLSLMTGGEDGCLSWSPAHSFHHWSAARDTRPGPPSELPDNTSTDNPSRCACRIRSTEVYDS